ncbi:hypothetical protein WHI96_11710 [Pseudonocardia tropica]|uniref:Uncharacterized protein n=1 Tax=Pseudonocardia tropica TaxID=681289 RepID=A0ABV1JUW7_9PSEU
MDTEIGDGAWTALRGRGGVRCEPLDDGVLRLGPAELTVLEPAAAVPPDAGRGPSGGVSAPSAATT